MMGFGARRPPLPAPTEPSTLSSVDNDTSLPDDVDTNVSSRTDKTSYSIPEDGTPVTINTTKREGGFHKKYPSQTSLLIEYFEGGKSEGKVSARPSVRVRVTPSSRKNKNATSNDHVQITQTTRNTRKPIYTRRVSLGSKPRDEVIQHSITDASYSEGSNVSSLPPVEIEVLQNASDLSSNGGRFIPMASDISSMPPDSMLEGEPIIKTPGRRRSRSLEREEVLASKEVSDTLKAPTRQRSRSLSKERITARVMEKLQQKPAESVASKSKHRSTGSREDLSSPRKSHRKTSRSRREEEMSGISGTESSLLSSNVHRRSGDTQSMRSGVSGTSSINNPKLLATVEDAIKRLILPELTALKEEQRTQKNTAKFENMSRESAYEPAESIKSRDSSRRRVSKSSSAPHIHGSKPKVVLNRDENDPGTILSGGSSRHRRSSRGSVSERSYAESTEEKVRHKKSKDSSRHSTREAALAGLAASGLTAAALKGHTAREEEKAERKERRKRHSKSRSRTASISESIEDEHFETPFQEPSVPPLPILQSELQGSELTRDSILSAETETRERPDSSSSRHTGADTPLREVARGFASPSPRTPSRTPNSTQRGLGNAHSNHSQGAISNKSDRSYFSRPKETSTAAQEAAAAAKARAIERATPQSPQYEIAEATPTRGLSPIQSEASYREEHLETGSPRQLRSVHSGASLSSVGRKDMRPQSTLSIQSFESSPSTKAARTRKRPTGVSLERAKEVLGEPETPRDVDEFFEKNHEQNEQYRREYEASLHDSPRPDSRRMTGYTEESEGGQYPEPEEQRLSLSQDIRKVGSNPEYVHTPIAVESAVASLLEPSSISVQSSAASPVKKSRISRVSPTPEYQHYKEDSELQEQPSRERWNAIRGQAQTLADKSRAGSSPRHSLSVSLKDEPQMNHSALPTGHMEPEFGYGVDDESDVITNPSIINGPGGAQYDDRTEELLSRQEEREQRTPTRSYGKAAAIGAAAGLAAAAATHSRNQSPASYDPQRESLMSDNYELHYDQPPLNAQPSYSRDRTPSRSPALWKDEGYQSAHQPGAVTPDFRDRRDFDETMDHYDESPLGAEPFDAADAKHTRHLSGNSHGMASPLYDSATGRGLDRIESKDIVALMDHLTVRDAQRNARDTEILVTLVRSAAEMRNTFEELKQFIRVQDAMVMNNTDKRVDLAEQRIIGGPRPQPAGSPRAPRSSTEDLDYETKKKNVFKRALKGLGSKGDKDIKNIEAMLIQLLGEVEGLKQVNQLTLDQQRTNSMTSYEHMRAHDVGAPESGYEPEGRANTASSPNQSGYLSNPSTSRRIQDLHSGFDVPQTQRISTVHEEDDEEYLEDEPHYENTERMTTPTQEARRNNSLSHDTPPQAARTFRDSQSQENTPKKKHKSNSSSIFGIPKISRWSKTTASTNRDSESLPRNSGSAERRPYSSASRSGSQVNIPYGDGQYEMHDDDRIRSTASLPRDGRESIRSPSPLIPEDPEQYAMEDPKYQAHRNSLNLQHPQPKHGPTGRHTNQLDQQARIFDPISSPDYDQWGSNPSLARNRMSGGAASYNAGNLSPISSEGGYSQHSASEQQAPPRPPKILDDGPLIPPQQPLAGHGQARQMYSSPNEYGGQGTLTPLAPIQEVRYSLETDTGHRYTPTPSPRPSTQNLASPQRKITGPRPMGSRSPNPGAQHGRDYQTELQHSDTVIRRKPVAADTESLESYRSSLDSEIF